MKTSARFLSITILSTLVLLGGACKYKQTNYSDIVRAATIALAIPPLSDTTATVLLSSGAISYNVDSFVASTEMNSGLQLKHLTTAKITGCFISISNSQAGNNFANLESCNTSFYSDITATPLGLSMAGMPDVFATELVYQDMPADNLKAYLINNNREGVKQFYYSVTGKLRRSLSDTLKCTLHITFDLHLEKEETKSTKFDPFNFHLK